MKQDENKTNQKRGDETMTSANRKPVTVHDVVGGDNWPTDGKFETIDDARTYVTNYGPGWDEWGVEEDGNQRDTLEVEGQLSQFYYKRGHEFRTEHAALYQFVIDVLGDDPSLYSQERPDSSEYTEFWSGDNKNQRVN